MRLDHLLSKEQLAPRGAFVPAGVHCFLVERWLFIRAARAGAAGTLPVLRGCGTGAGPAGWVGTLLGSEGTGIVRVFGCRPGPSSCGCGMAVAVLSVS